MIVLVTGGSGCGKSTWAEGLMDRLNPANRLYLATMQVPDEESRRRVKRHRQARAGKGYKTIEQSMNLGGLELDGKPAVLLEDLPNLVANEIFSKDGDVSRILPDLEGLCRKCGHLIMVTNDVFSDGRTYAPSVVEWQKELAEVNRQAAAWADAVVEVVYGIPVALKGTLP